MDLSPRVAERVLRDFTESEREQAAYVLQTVHPPLYRHSPASDDRVHAAMLRLANGSLTRLLDAAALAEVDWRDLLVAAELANGDWPVRVDEILGSSF